VAEVLRGLRARGFAWCALREALDDPAFLEFRADPARTGLLTGDFPRSLAARLAARAAGAAQRAGWFGTRRLGPRWPQLD
jgi:hypothetical protein